MPALLTSLQLQKSAVEDALVLKISSDCRCNVNKSNLLDSSIECKGNNELTYIATLEYSSDNGSETASIITERIVRQLPFSMAVGGAQLTVTSACADCEMPTNEVAKAASLSQAIGGGLFIGGFVAAILIAVTLIIIVYVYQYLHNFFAGTVDPGGAGNSHALLSHIHLEEHNLVSKPISTFYPCWERGPGDKPKAKAVCYC